MKKRRILLIARDLLPYCHTLGGTLRIIKLAQFLSRAKYDVSVVASSGIELHYFGYETAINNLDVHYVPDRFQRYMNAKHFARTASATHSDLRRRGPVVRRLVKSMQTIANELATPDFGIFFTSGLYRTAADLILRFGITNTIVTAPPFSTHIVGLRLKWRFGNQINLISDYRDSWNGIPVFAKRWAVTGAVNRLLEKKALLASDWITYQSPRVIKKIEIMFPGVSIRSQLVMNGFDPSM